MAESFSMTGGDGPNSYFRNSEKQKKAADKAKALMGASIFENLDISNSSNQFSIVDMGCATGPNTFIAIEGIIQCIIQKYKMEEYSHLPEFQVFFNDLVSNDFNILFANLPPSRKYFASGVPGLFHGRLFPKASLNFVYSSMALHWLSEVPEELGDLNSPACNKGRIYLRNAPNEVVSSYASQYAKDMESFLASRAEEVAPGGLMALLIPGRPDGAIPSQSSLSTLFHPLESTLLDMADEGIVSKDQIDTLNLPMYSPSREELETLVQKNGYFGIAKMELLLSQALNYLTAEECRGGLQNILSKHFGSDIIGEIFERYATKIVGHPPIGVDDVLSNVIVFVLLKCNHRLE